MNIIDDAQSLLLKIYQINSTPGKFVKESEIQDKIGLDKSNSDLITETSFILRDVLAGFLGYLEFKEKPSSPKYKITPTGFKFLYDSLSSKKKTNQAFCAMWFSQETEPVWLDAIKPAISMAGYEPKRIDEVQFNHEINAQMILEINKSKFVVADFTGDRGGVYWEAGYAHALKLQVIYTCNKESFDDQQPHFDISHYNFLLWDKKELDSFQNKLFERIVSTIL